MIIQPIAIHGTDYRKLEKIDETSAPYRESWLQETLHKNPCIYPLESPLDQDIKIISLGREISTSSGSIDLLLLTSEAQLIVVETKLWRNPEKSRTVLAQIIDYAKELNNWRYEELNQAIISVQRHAKLSAIHSLEDILKREFGEDNYIEFLDQLAMNLERGDFLLSIIGDRISPNLMLLSDSIQSSPGLNFTIALIEMKLYSYNNGIILIPDIVGRTKEVTRGVVKVRYEQERPKVDIAYLEPEQRKSTNKTDKETFLSQCPDDIQEYLDKWLTAWESNRNLLVYWGTKGLSIRKQTDDKWTTILDIYPDSISMVISSLAEKNQIPDEIYQDYLDVIFDIDGVKSAYSAKKRYIYYTQMSTEDVQDMLNAVGDLIARITG